MPLPSLPKLLKAHVLVAPRLVLLHALLPLTLTLTLTLTTDSKPDPNPNPDSDHGP